MKKETKKIVWFSISSFFAGILFCIGGILLIVHFANKSTQVERIKLLQSTAYNDTIDGNAPQFTYQSATDTDLVRVRVSFNLDSIAGDGDEISKIKNLMYYVHNTIVHDGYNSAAGIDKNSIDLVKYCKETGKGVNCRMLATILNEYYLSMGFYSRFVVCLPQDSTDTDCHVVNIVYSQTLDKWIMMDPTFAAYVTDKENNLLNLEEIRTHLINGLPLILNKDANRNHKTKQTVDYYLKTYMAKNLYWLECPTESGFATESKDRDSLVYVRLCPVKYTGFHHYGNDYITNNTSYFWQKP